MKRNFIQGKFALLTFASQALLVASALTMASAASAAINDTAIFDFNLPATSSFDNQNTVYPNYVSLATLTLTEDANGVIFTLDPNQANLGYSTPTQSRVTRLSIAFELSTTPDPLVWSNVSGAPVEDLVVVTGNDNIETSYSAADQYINIGFFNPNNNDPNVNDRFYVEETSTWRIENTTVAQFTGTMATTTSNKPNPIFGVISVSPFSNLPNVPNTSNWVASASTPTMVPEPTNLALLGIGLVGFVVARRRHLKR